MDNTAFMESKLATGVSLWLRHRISFELYENICKPSWWISLQNDQDPSKVTGIIVKNVTVTDWREEKIKIILGSEQKKLAFLKRKQKNGKVE